LKIVCAGMILGSIGEKGSNDYVVKPFNHPEIKVHVRLDDENEHESLDFTIYILPILNKGDHVGGLLLKPSQNSRGEYKRIGVYWRHGTAILMPLLEDPTCCAKDSDYAEVSYDENGMACRIIVLI